MPKQPEIGKCASCRWLSPTSDTCDWWKFLVNDVPWAICEANVQFPIKHEWVNCLAWKQKN